MLSTTTCRLGLGCRGWGLVIGVEGVGIGSEVSGLSDVEHYHL